MSVNITTTFFRNFSSSASSSFCPREDCMICVTLFAWCMEPLVEPTESNSAVDLPHPCFSTAYDRAVRNQSLHVAHSLRHEHPVWPGVGSRWGPVCVE